MLANRIFLVSLAGAVLLVAIIALGFTLDVGACRDFREAELEIGDETFSVAIADEQIERTRGLAGCDDVPVKVGMYFPYQQPTEATYWMKGMLIPIDIVWIKDGVVVGVEDHIPPPPSNAPDQELLRYKSPGPVTAVLEIKAGGAGEYGITEGAAVDFPAAM